MQIGFHRLASVGLTLTFAGLAVALAGTAYEVVTAGGHTAIALDGEWIGFAGFGAQREGDAGRWQPPAGGWRQRSPSRL